MPQDLTLCVLTDFHQSNSNINFSTPVYFRLHLEYCNDYILFYTFLPCFIITIVTTLSVYFTAVQAVLHNIFTFSVYCAALVEAVFCFV